VGMVLLLVYEFWGSDLVEALIGNGDISFLVDMTVTRFIGGVIFLLILINLGYRVLNPVRAPFLRSLVFCLPAFLVAINNFPFIPVITGKATINGSPSMIALLLLECLCIGFFEELAFRGLFLWIAEKKRGDKRWIFCSILLSSAAFGLIHLINLFESSPLSVLMQIGYSALIGAMCAVILLKTANIWLCVVVHGLFNFCGAVVPSCGYGTVWDTPTVILTAVIAVAVTVYMTVAFLRVDLGILDAVYGENN
jgi:membrane protease YdiL (CAAX protease family)